MVQLIVFWWFTSIRTLRISEHCCYSSGHTSGLCFRILNASWPWFFFLSSFWKQRISGSDDAGMKLYSRVFLDRDGQSVRSSEGWHMFDVFEMMPDCDGFDERR